MINAYLAHVRHSSSPRRREADIRHLAPSHAAKTEPNRRGIMRIILASKQRKSRDGSSPAPNFIEEKIGLLLILINFYFI